MDTPGIGSDNPKLTDKLFDFLPNALAFIYVLNSSNNGGVQEDRVSMSKLCLLLLLFVLTFSYYADVRLSAFKTYRYIREDIYVSKVDIFTCEIKCDTLKLSRYYL